MKTFISAKKNASRVALLVLLAASATLLTSCESTPTAAEGDGVFKFTVMRYPEPVEVAAWKPNPSQSDNPEGAALNIATFMEQGDVDHWLASWDAAERPTLTPEERNSLVQKWLALKGGRVSMIGRVVGGADVVVELSVLDAQQTPHKIQLPLKHDEGQWWLTSLDAGSEYLQWETSTNKILSSADPTAFRAYLNSVNLASAR